MREQPGDPALVPNPTQLTRECVEAPAQLVQYQPAPRPQIQLDRVVGGAQGVRVQKRNADRPDGKTVVADQRYRFAVLRDRSAGVVQGERRRGASLLFGQLMLRTACRTPGRTSGCRRPGRRSWRTSVSG